MPFKKFTTNNKTGNAYYIIVIFKSFFFQYLHIKKSSNKHYNYT